MCCSVTTGKVNCFNLLTSASWPCLKTPERWGFLLNKGRTCRTGSSSIWVKRISVEFTALVGAVLHSSNVRCSLSSSDREYLRSAINAKFNIALYSLNNQINQMIESFQVCAQVSLQCSNSPLDWHCQVTLIKSCAINVLCAPLRICCTHFSRQRISSHFWYNRPLSL